jgi:hypothetical protein
MKIFEDPKEEEKIWDVRESGLGATAYVPGMADTWTGWEDSAAPPERLGRTAHCYRKRLRGWGTKCAR